MKKELIKFKHLSSPPITTQKYKLHFFFLNTKNGLPCANNLLVRERFFKTYLPAAGGTAHVR